MDLSAQAQKSVSICNEKLGYEVKQWLAYYQH